MINAAESSGSSLIDEEEGLRNAWRRWRAMGRRSTKEDKSIYQKTREALGLTREKAAELFHMARPDHVVIGPADASIAYINDVHRRTLYVKSKDITFLEAVQQRMNELEKSEEYSGKVRISCNLNPMNLI